MTFILQVTLGVVLAIILAPVIKFILNLAFIALVMLFTRGK